MNQPNQTQATPGQSRPMYRPEQMRNLSILSDVDKEKYEKGLRTLYQTMEQHGPDTPAHIAAKKKIEEFSRMVYSKMQGLQQRQRQAAAQQGGGQPGPGGQPSQAGPGQAQNPAMAAQRAAVMAAQRPAGLPTGAGNVAATTASGGGDGATLSQHQPSQLNPGGQQQKIPQPIIDHVNQFHIVAPPQITGNREAAQKWVSDIRNRYIRGLVTLETVNRRLKSIDQMIKDKEVKGTPLEGDELKRFTDQRQADLKSQGEASAFVTTFRKQQEAWKVGTQGGSQQTVATAAGQGQQQPRPQPAQGSANAASMHPNMQAATASVVAAMDAAKNQQMAAANRGQQLPQTAITQPASGSAQTSAPSTQSHPANAPAPAPQPQVKIEPGSHPHPPPVNTAVAAASNSHMPSTGTPTQNSARVHTPQTATPVTAPGQARPLTHSAALSLANRQSTNSVPTVGQPGSAGVTTTPGSGNLMGSTPQGGHTHAHPQQTPQPATAMTNKMPIPKVLPDAATRIPQATVMTGGVQPGRPTYGGGTGYQGGVMNTPVVQRHNAFTFEAEGEHVLSKKKLDELVRQVCGGGPPGRDGNYLTPDVEESVLNVADNFVDNVLHMACRLAKERGSKVLEIRDIQVVLERVYNIRIPGFTSDELRTVRKAQPSSAWIAKMSAVQAAKVMPGKDDK